MKERPILFSAPMVRAILDGTKTQTRRAVKLRHGADVVVVDGRVWKPARVDYAGYVDCPYGKSGDRLWVREAWQDVHPVQVADGRYSQAGQAGIPGPPGVTYRTIYRADGPYPVVYHSHVSPFRRLQPDPEHGSTWAAESGFTGWTPSIYMPRWASRITLEVTGVRVERLQDISEADAQEEGVRGIPRSRDLYPTDDFRYPFMQLWESINGPRSWDANPWVWVVEFRRIEKDRQAA